ncbi:branched-chain amino acid ABC transporter permease [Leucobacter coleopterorum]|uniref:Branched-chain amino acid ABC transporter permease n=1 Tax=Leucobacter coleopterorum TaxID=2714933 RepID=A0ABX6K132_9MICO|nr:AzlC family ABC transporter permease [Leucobacter coleopterorum]QIM18795.1 branched-chain amino acid ABC transporter permease [Leucobacter coleopterorum]
MTESLAPAQAEDPQSSQLRAGLADSLGVGIGIFPLGFALGVLVIQSGLPWWLAPALSIGIFAGSVELLMVSMLAAATPILTIAVTVLAVNFRHVFYALSFPIQRVRRGLPRAYSVYALIDEAYATYVLMAPERLSSRRIVTGQLAMQAYWVSGGLVGVLVARTLPEPIEGFEFALVALFVVMTLDAIRGRREIPSAVLAGLSIGVAILIVPDQALLAALAVYAVLLTLRFATGRHLHSDESSGKVTNG